MGNIGGKMRLLRGMLAVTILLTIIVTFTGNSAAEEYAIPQRTDSNVIVASYNIKWFGNEPHDLAKLALVIENFDVCGIEEVKKESEVKRLAQVLNQWTGYDWGYVYGVRTHRPHGRYHEAFAAVWRRDRVQLGNGLISNVWDKKESYRNDPYVVSFKRHNFDFALVLIRTRWYIDNDGTRAGEVKQIGKFINWIKTFLKERDIILAGDFNYSGGSQVMKNMSQASGLKQIDPNAKSTFKKDYSGYASSYDHIYISSSDTSEFIDGQCALLDATLLVYGGRSIDNMKDSKKELSDHLPVWAAFDVTKVDDD